MPNCTTPQDATGRQKTRREYCKGILWALVGIIFAAFYTATLTANLTVEKFNARINSPADLLGKRVCTVAGTAPAAYLNNLGVQAKSLDSIKDCYADLKKGNLDAVVFDSPVLRFNTTHEGAGLCGVPPHARNIPDGRCDRGDGMQHVRHPHRAHRPPFRSPVVVRSTAGRNALTGPWGSSPYLAGPWRRPG